MVSPPLIKISIHYNDGAHEAVADADGFGKIPAAAYEDAHGLQRFERVPAADAQLPECLVGGLADGYKLARRRDQTAEEVQA